MKILKAISIILFGLILTLGGISLGITLEKKNNEEIEQATHKTTSVAVINLDEGVSVDGNYKYYSGELLTLPNSDYVITSYDDAMNGVSEGRYGAYVIIPATFSESVESLNGTPIEAFIQYEFDPQLSEEAKFTVQQNIAALDDALGDSVSYVYVANVMENLHNAQDDAKGVLSNDIDDLDNITAIDADSLAVAIEYRDLDIVAYDLENVDVSSYITTNTNNINQIQGVYNDAKTKSDAQVAGIKEKLNGIDTSITQYGEYVNGIDILHDGNGDLLVKNQLAEVADKLNLTEEARTQNKNGIKHDIKKQLYCAELGYQSYVNSSLTTYNQNINNDINSWYSGVKSGVEASVQQQLDNYIQQALNNAAMNPGYMYTPGSYTVSISWDSCYSAGALSGIDISQARNSYSNVPCDETNPTVVSAIESMTLSSAVSDSIDAYEIAPAEVITIINDEIIATYMTEMERETGKILDDAKSIKTDFSTYYSELATYDPSKNLDTAALSNIASDLNTNNSNMSQTINQNIYDNNQYIYNLQTTTNTNIALLRQDISDANEATIVNVENAVETLKSNREKLNSNNVELLTDFTEILPYSRVGELENQRMYKYIINPVVFENRPTIQKADSIEKADERIAMMAVCAGGFVVICVLLAVIYVQSRKEKLVEVKSINHK